MAMSNDGNRFRNLLAATPCARFCPAAHLCLSSYLIPLGFDRPRPRALHKNQLAFASLGTDDCCLQDGCFWNDGDHEKVQVEMDTGVASVCLWVPSPKGACRHEREYRA